MKFSIFPKEEKFFEMFEHQATLIEKVSKQFNDLVHDYTDVEAKITNICDLEDEGDTLLHDIAVKLNQTFVTPIDREDIHLLSNHMDDILDFVQGAAQRMLMFEVKEPKDKLVELAEILTQCATLLSDGIKRLPKFEDISELRKEMNRLETQGDKINRTAIAALFHDCESVADVLDLIKWKEIIEKAENAIDKFEDVFDVLESVVIKHA